MNRVRSAARFAFWVHLLAGMSMAVIMRRGLDTNPNLEDRLGFLMQHRALWTLGWSTWTIAAFAIFYFYFALSETHQPPLRLAVFLTAAALGPDLGAQAIEIGMLPDLAVQASSTKAAADVFLGLHRLAVLMSGYVANGLYSASALLLAWSTRRAFPRWVWLGGLVTALSGFALSVAALLNSADGMFWTNVLLVPALLIWLGGIAFARSASTT